jgi:hypothetical protein
VRNTPAFVETSNALESAGSTTTTEAIAGRFPSKEDHAAPEFVPRTSELAMTGDDAWMAFTRGNRSDWVQPVMYALPNESMAIAPEPFSSLTTDSGAPPRARARFP